MLKHENVTSLFADQFDACSLLTDMKVHFPDRFNKVLKVWERYTLEKHTIMVLGQFEKYFAHKPLPVGITNAQFRLFLAFHDLGKPVAESEGSKQGQAKYNVETFDNFYPREPFIGNEHREILRSMLKADPIGLYIKEMINLEASETMIRGLRPELSAVSDSEFFRLFLMYYMCDAGSYTEDAGGRESLDKHFYFGVGEMRFSDATQSKMAPLMGRFMKG
jgi:hypothetical protein